MEAPAMETPLTLAATSILNYRLNGAPSLVPVAGNDYLDFTGGVAVAAGGAATVNIGGALNIGGAALPVSYRLIRAPANLTGTFTLGTQPAGVVAVLDPLGRNSLIPCG